MGKKCVEKPWIEREDALITVGSKAYDSFVEPSSNFLQ